MNGKQSEPPSVILALNISGFIHLYALYCVFKVANIFAAIGCLFLPGVSQGYVAWAYAARTGTWWNANTIVMLVGLAGFAYYAWWRFNYGPFGRQRAK